MRGEDRRPRRERKGYSGSPPHARGRPEAALEDTQAERITPACAGKTGAVALIFFFVSDHPRMRGEDENEAFAAKSV